MPLREETEVRPGAGPLVGGFAPDPVYLNTATSGVPPAASVDAVRPSTTLVAVSLVQSADGRVLDLDGLLAATAAHGTATFLDATQAAGWLPVDDVDAALAALT